MRVHQKSVGCARGTQWGRAEWWRSNGAPRCRGGRGQRGEGAASAAVSASNTSVMAVARASAVAVALTWLVWARTHVPAEVGGDVELAHSRHEAPHQHALVLVIVLAAPRSAITRRGQTSNARPGLSKYPGVTWQSLMSALCARKTCF